MNKKSTELRITQTKQLIAAYESAGLGDDRNCRFARDMLHRLGAGKALTVRQRGWLDSIIEQGVPTPKGDPEFLKRLQDAAAVPGVPESEARVLADFASRIRRGWTLSQKQAAWVEKLLARAEHVRVHGPWAPDELTIERLKRCVQLSRGYTAFYWQTHDGAFRALDKVYKFLSGELSSIDEWSTNKLLKAMARPLREFENPRFKVGEMCWYRTPGLDYESALVTAAPLISIYGHVVYPVLVDGNLIETANLTKRRGGKK